MAAKKQLSKYQPIFIPGQDLSKLSIFLISGSEQAFRNVRIVKEDEFFIQFFYKSVVDDAEAEAMYHKAMIAGFAWR